MTGIPTPADLPAATRGEFLAHRERAVRELQKELSSPLGIMQNCGLMAGATVALMMAAMTLDDVGAETGDVVIAVVMAAAAVATAPTMVRRARRTRQLTTAFLAWEIGERQARSLPPGQIRPDLRTPFDARRDPDFEHFARAAALRARVLPLPLWVVHRALPGGVGVLVGVLMLLGALRDGPVGSAVLFGAAAVYLLVSSLLVLGSAARTGWRLGQILRAERADIRAWRAERAVPSADAEPAPGTRRQQALLVAPLAVMGGLYLWLTLATGLSQTATLALEIVLSAGLVTGVVLLVRRVRRRAAAPADHDLTAVPPR